MSVKSSGAGAAALLLISASVGLGAYACLLGPSNTVPQSGGGWSLEADPSALLIVRLTFSMVGLGALGVCLGLFALRRGWRPPARALLWGGLLAAAVLALVPVGGSTDVQSYALYGRMGDLGLDPYRTVPQSLIDAGDPVAAYSPQTWRDTPSVYGPVANWAFAAAAGLAGASMFKIVFLLKLAAGAAFALVALVLHRLARDPVRVHLLWTCNPLMLWACVAGAHADVYGAAVMVLAFAVFLRTSDAPGWAPAMYAGALIGIAGGVKAPFFFAGLGLAWAARRSWPALAGLAGGVTATGLGSYLLAGPAAFDVLLDKAGDVAPTNPWRYFPHWGVEMTHEEMAGWGYAAGAVILLVLLWRLTPAGDRAESAARVSFAVCAALLLLSPVQHPWYDPLIFPLLALLPPTRVDGLTQWRLAAGTLGYLPGVPQFTGNPWPDPMPFIRNPVNNWWVSAALGIIAVVMVLVLLPPGRRAPEREPAMEEKEALQPV
ncbi:polyprenol phosphomannose-dependent alpha 1,6 mannosyltransferase MptB [Actinocorallia sp. B10E7]|uniref:polyprenol phosphomannose-dependent alpha 1,6 mannosyltransferase MptB n=1 Tax=Actinocorallia sp. B10E7 TaxID=3153558 RepID=UPI00325C54A7